MLNTILFQGYEYSPVIQSIEAIENIFLVKKQLTVDSKTNTNWCEAVYVVPMVANTSDLVTGTIDKIAILQADKFCKVTTRFNDIAMEWTSKDYIETDFIRNSTFRWDTDWVQPTEVKVMCVRPYLPLKVSVTYSSYSKQDFLTRQAFGLWFVFSARLQGWVYGQTTGYAINRLESSTIFEPDCEQLTPDITDVNLWFATQFQRFFDYVDLGEIPTFLRANSTDLLNLMSTIKADVNDGQITFIDDDSLKLALSKIVTLPAEENAPFVVGAYNDIN